MKIIRYAVRDWIGGPRLPEPLVNHDATGTRLEFYYDSAEGAIAEPDTLEMFDHAARFIEEGTPVRLSNRAGIGTMGSRKHDGIGFVSVIFEILPT
ncbi:MAG: hypothetical protein EON58_21080 [Alphaproteobacteria bacterium]|nr:MAG: hypothetical protein EON58_21080 [Alphaproteobacteria bacterium]